MPTNVVIFKYFFCWINFCLNQFCSGKSVKKMLLEEKDIFSILLTKNFFVNVPPTFASHYIHEKVLKPPKFWTKIYKILILSILWNTLGKRFCKLNSSVLYTEVYIYIFFLFKFFLSQKNTILTVKSSHMGSNLAHV